MDHNDVKTHQLTLKVESCGNYQEHKKGDIMNKECEADFKTFFLIMKMNPSSLQ